MDGTTSVQRPKLWGSCRLTYAFCAFLSNIVNVSMTSSLNLAILCMQKPEKTNNTLKFINFKNKCGEVVVSQSSTYDEHGEMDWSRDQQWLFLAFYYYGLMAMQPIAGRIVDRFGAKWFLLGTMLAEAMLYCLMPTLARWSYHVAAAARLIQGLLAAFVPCSIYKLFVTWGQGRERQGLLAIANSGTYFGALVIFPITSALCRIGWAYVFYSIGLGAGILAVILQLFVFDSIDDHPRISREEYDYLKENKVEKAESKNVPWLKLFTSAPVLAFIVTHFCNAYGFIMVIIYLPRFYKEELNFSVNENGVFMSFVYIGQLLINVSVSLFITKLYDRLDLSLTVYRKIGVAIGDILLILLYLIVPAMTCEKRVFIVIMFFFVGCSMGISFSGGYWPTALDLAPAYAGLIVGVANSAAHLDGVIIPNLLARTFLGDNSDYVFYSIACMQTCSIFVYTIFGSSKRVTFT